MNKYYKPLNLNPDSFIGQFILTKNCDLIPESWNRYEKDQWFLGVLELPVTVIENQERQMIGWCLGHPVSHKEPWATKIVIECENGDSIDMRSVENFYQNTGGRFAFVLLTKKEAKFLLDTFGSLAAVYSTFEPTVASTPTLLGEKYEWNTGLISLLNMPESDRWFPLGLTPKEKVRRLLPNHYLNLNDWSVGRHWPVDKSDLAVEEDIDKNVSNVISCLKKTIGIIANRYPIQASLTAGRDTRMVLACMRDHLENSHFITFAEDDETVDMQIASRLVEKLGLRHSFVPIRAATDDEMLRWLYVTGHAAGGEIWKIHKTLEDYDRQRVMLNGVAAIGGVSRVRKNDLLNEKISGADLLGRYNLPCEEMLVSEADKWLCELSAYHSVVVANLSFLEQRMACWAAPQFYGNIFSRFEISPFNHRRIYQAMMRLPHEYWWRKELANDICRRLWPELLELPFNEFIGLKNYVHKTKRYINKTKKNSVRFTKNLVKRLVK